MPVIIAREAHQGQSLPMILPEVDAQLAVTVKRVVLHLLVVPEDNMAHSKVLELMTNVSTASQAMSASVQMPQKLQISVLQDISAQVEYSLTTNGTMVRIQTLMHPLPNLENTRLQAQLLPNCALRANILVTHSVENAITVPLVTSVTRSEPPKMSLQDQKKDQSARRATGAQLTNHLAFPTHMVISTGRLLALQAPITMLQLQHRLMPVSNVKQDMLVREKLSRIRVSS